MRVLNVVGARPNFMKIAPLVREWRKQRDAHVLLVHTGQHYDDAMSGVFFRELGLPEPDINLGVGSGSHAVQTAEVMKAFEPIVLKHHPDWVVVVGDVNSTLACSLTAVKMGVPVAHVEAGLRSFDRTMPEEINRILTDAISRRLFVTERDAIENLKREGVPEERIHFVGNVMIDTLMRHRHKAMRSGILDRLELTRRGYALVTLHRPSNVDEPRTLRRVTNAIRKVADRLPVVWPVHPRTRDRLEAAGLWGALRSCKRLRLCGSLGYLDFLRLMESGAVVLTDSGGVQEETTVLGVPCVTLRENTERPVTVSEGTNTLVGVNGVAILRAVDVALGNHSKPVAVPELWDGHAAKRVVRILMKGTAP